MMDKKAISIERTDQDINFGVLFEHGKVKSIAVFTPDGSGEYHFNPKEGQQGITDGLLKEALTAMIGNNIAAFEMIYTTFEKQEYRDIAQQVFKEHWNNLYNTVVADDIFGREVAFSSICKVFDFFEEKK